MTMTAPTGLAWAPIADVDPEVWQAMLGERRRQHDKIELIASENYVFGAVLEAQGSWLTNKYAEGLPGKRYYGGCEFVDIVETLAIERKPLGDIDKLAAAVIALAGVAFCILVGKLRPLRRHDRRARVILGGDQLDVLFLPPVFGGNGVPQFGILLGQGG